ncbi:MAG: PilZ domain-containing protein [Acidobacteriota bacterium]|nr:PilZ domain-containing protein [Acidobacteriota bacterium]
MRERANADSPFTSPSLPVFVRPHGPAGDSGEEATRLFNITSRSATLLLTRPPELGQLLRLTLPPARPQPAQPRGNNFLWALVWAVAPPGEAGGEGGDPRHHVSVVFVGDEIPTAGDGSPRYTFLAEEDGRFRLQRLLADPLPPARRRQRRESRISIPVEVTVETLGADGSATSCEQTVTENISRGGAAVWTSLDARPRQLVRLTSERHHVSLTAVVRARRTGPDGITRLHLEFIDGQWPMERMQ